MRLRKPLRKSPACSFLAALFLVMCTAQGFAQVDSADWIGGSGVWSNPEMWYCSGSISDLDGDCVPNGFNVDVSFDRGGQAILDKSASTNALILSNGSSLSVGSGVSLTNALEDIIDGSLTISGGGVVKDSSASVGLAGSGTATVTGKGSQWQFAGGLSGLTIGGAGQGTLLIENGGVVSGAPAGLGDTAGSSGTATVTGLGSQWNSSFLNIGVSGRGTLTINSGGAVNVVGSGVSLGSQAGAQGTVTVTGLGSQFNITPEVVVGGGGQGTLTLQQGATGSSLNLYVGGVAGATGTVMLTDSGTKWTNSTGTVIVGDAGTGTLTVQNGAEFSAQNEMVGYSHVGTLNLSGGSNSVTDTLTLGKASGSTGTYNLSGTGSLTVAGQGISNPTFAMTVGDSGTGYFFQKGGTNTVNGLSLLIGNKDFGSYVESAGQTSVSASLFLGGSGGTTAGTGQYLLSGSGILAVTEDEYTGFTGTGTFKQSGGTNTTAGLYVGAGSSGSGTYDLSGGGVLKTVTEILGTHVVGTSSVGGKGVFNQTGGTNQTGVLVVGAGPSSYNLSGGTLTVTAGETVLGLANASGGGGTFNQTGGTNSASTLAIAGTLCATCSAVGTYNLSAGALKTTNVTVNGVLNLSGTGALTVGNLLIGDTFGRPGIMTLTGGSISVNATSTTNDGKIVEQNVGTGSTIHWGKFTGNAPIITGSLTTSFTDLTLSPNGYFQSAPGSRFDIAGNFINGSTQNMLWNTSTSRLDFTGGGSHLFTLAGQKGAGSNNNFAWGTLAIDAGNTLDLSSGSGDALYVSVLQGLDVSGGAVTNVEGGPGVFLYYNPEDNPQLHGTYTLVGGGEMIAFAPSSHPTPEPTSLALLGSGLLGLGILLRGYSRRPR